MLFSSHLAFPQVVIFSFFVLHVMLCYISPAFIMKLFGWMRDPVEILKLKIFFSRKGNSRYMYYREVVIPCFGIF